MGRIECRYHSFLNPHWPLGDPTSWPWNAQPGCKQSIPDLLCSRVWCHQVLTNDTNELATGGTWLSLPTIVQYAIGASPERSCGNLSARPLPDLIWTVSDTSRRRPPLSYCHWLGCQHPSQHPSQLRILAYAGTTLTRQCLSDSLPPRLARLREPSFTFWSHDGSDAGVRRHSVRAKDTGRRAPNENFYIHTLTNCSVPTVEYQYPRSR